MLTSLVVGGHSVRQGTERRSLSSWTGQSQTRTDQSQTNATNDNREADAAYPVGRGEVDRLGEVEALVEAGVVRSGQGDDELAGVLVSSEYRHTCTESQACKRKAPGKYDYKPIRLNNFN